jgi:hypothetical protein
VGCASEDHAAIVLPQPVFGSGLDLRCQRHSFPRREQRGSLSVFRACVSISRSRTSYGAHG